MSELIGVSNLGSLTIYYYATQTDSPQNGVPIGQVVLNNGSSGSINIFNGTQILPASAVNYIEIVEYASSEAMVDSDVDFTLNIQVI